MATRKRSEWEETGRFFAKLMLAILLLRSFVFAPFVIPSESMLPRLFVGDYLLVAKWPYGFTRWSLPWGLPLIPGHLFARPPARGDVVVFRSPDTPGNPETHDVIKRVIGLPGDTIQMRAGQLILNGVAAPKSRVADFTIPLTPNFMRCPDGHAEQAGAEVICRYQRYRETLPDGRSYFVLDTGRTASDDTGLYSVPAGHVFLMGDNRDNSADSRFPAPVGMGYIPMDRIEGRATVSVFSTDGSASWIKPWTWFTAARPERIGEGF